MPRNLVLKLSLDNKKLHKRNRKKIDDKYPNFDVEVGQKICLGACFLIRRFCTIVSLVCALKISSEVLILPNISNRIHSGIASAWLSWLATRSRKGQVLGSKPGWER